MKTAAIIHDRALILLDLDHKKRAWNVLFIMALLATRPYIGPTVSDLSRGTCVPGEGTDCGQKRPAVGSAS